MRSLSFFKGLSWMVFLNLLIKPVWIFFIDRRVQNLVGNEAYGNYFSLFGLSYVLLFLADAGLSSMVNQRIAQHERLNVTQVFIFKTGLILLYIITCLATGWITGSLGNDLFYYVIIIQALTSFFVFLRSIITAHQYFKTDAWFSVADKLLMIFICGSLLYGFGTKSMNLHLFLQIQLTCTFLVVVMAFWFLRHKRLIPGSGILHPGPILERMAPFACIILLMSAHYRLDGFLLEKINVHGATEAGIYAAAYRLLDAANMVGYLVASYLLPFIARNHKDKEIMTEAIKNTRHALLFLGIGLVMFVLMYADWLQQLLYHSDWAYHSVVLQLCITSLPGYFLVHIYGSVLTATGRLKAFITILLFSVLINILLNILLIPSYGAKGCCIAALVSQYFCGICSWITVSRIFTIPFDRRSVLMYVFTTCFVGGFFYFSKIALINTWIILLIAGFIILFLLLTQISYFKKYLVLLR